ncbi:HtaA domain-containing protein [Corynebacterium sp. UMB4614]|uniref:HtaA domain-containing protein n=1 Tax=Corynebacterium sp. UMB4614 TaxID=3046334 RepID=UPI00254BF140|nr:HtaA domain-containing protein [Corynebacterium sp. UMB4614]MDK7134504.1 HtaA domain-containing protein [Corynebacterium sp. UMB4614]
MIVIAKNSRRITSVGIALGMFSIGLGPVLVPIAGAQTEQTALPASETTESGNGSLDWALRDSFLRYSLGATNVTDGATKIYSNGTDKPSSESDTVEQHYRFNLKKATFEEASQTTRAEFEGRVEYFKYCEGKPAQRGNCALELTIKDPTIVLSPDGSHVEADVRSKQYPSGKIFEKDDAKIAQAWTKTAKFEQKGGKSSWEGINTSLTEDGVHTFSGFYDLGGPLAPLSFEYEGEGGRPGNDSAPLTIGDRFRSNQEVGPNRMLGLRDYVALATRVSSESKTAVELFDPKTMQAIGAPLEAPLRYDESLLYTEGADNNIYWVEGKSLKAATASAQGWSTPVTLHDNVGAEPTGIAYDAANDRVGVIARGTTDDDSTLTWVTSTGKADTAKLTPAQDVVAAHNPETKLYGNGHNRDLYGEAGTFALASSMNVMSDGNILYLPAAAVSLANNETYRVPPVLIKPDGTAKLAEGGTHLGTIADGATYATRMSTDGTNVAFFSHDSSRPGMQFFRYEDGALSPQSDRGPVGDLQKVSDIAFVDGQALVTSESKSKLSWVDPATRTETESINLPNQKDTAGKHRNLLEWKNKVFAYSIETDNSTYLEHAVILRLDSTDPKQGDHTDQVEPAAPEEPGTEPEGQPGSEQEKPDADTKPGEDTKPDEDTKPQDGNQSDEPDTPGDSKPGGEGKKPKSVWERITGFFSTGFEWIAKIFDWLFSLLRLPFLGS